MANWISSKLKVAENLLHQIDQQAAESLNKGDKKESDGLDVNVSPKSTGTVPLRDQLKKKSHNDNFGKLRIDGASVGSSLGKDSINVKKSDLKVNKPDLTVKKPNLNAKPTLKDSDWTELLNTPKQPISRKGKQLKDGDKVEKVGLKVKGNGKVVGNTVRKGGYGDNEEAKRVVWDDGGGSSIGSYSRVGVANAVGNDDIGVVRTGDGLLDSDKSLVKDDSSLRGDSVSDEGNRGSFDDKGFGSADLRNGDNAGTVSMGLKSASFSGSDSDSDSSSSSDSEGEQEREERRQRRRQLLAAKAAAKALEAIKEQENVVARLEGEKQSLEKILEEQSNQAAQEASELQSMTMEMMEAAEAEKQKHNHTRMEFLARLAKLETENADLARSLATAQWNLQIKVNHLVDLRHQVEAKDVVLEELKRNTYSAHQARESSTSLMASKGFELEKEMLEDECAFITDKIARLQEKEMTLEANIEMTLKEMESSTEVEVELRRRLRQMTDHLIQKQAQVESLSSDKATLLFRIEAVSRLLDENKSLVNGGDLSDSREDLEAGTWKSTRSKLQPMFENKIQSGRQHLGSLLRQLDSIFAAGAIFLARNPAAKMWSLVYLVSLHLWVLYILFSPSQSTEYTSSVVLSLENINGSVGS